MGEKGQACILQHHVAAGTLGQVAGNLLADDLVPVPVFLVQPGGSELDALDGDIGIEAQTLVRDAVRIPCLPLRRV